MKITELYKVIDPIAKSHGYQRKGHIIWKKSGEITLLIDLQKSRWGGGIYVNFGLTPTRLINRPTPPSSGYWGIQERGESFEGPHREDFIALAQDHEDELSPADVSKALEWLLEWLNHSFGNADLLRTSIIAKDKTSMISKLGINFDEWILVDWAHNKLKDYDSYFKDII